MATALKTTLQNIDWPANVSAFVAERSSLNTIERGCHLISVWNHEISFQDSSNPALPFLQEMKASLFYVPACFSLGLYKPAASSMRAALENALYYTYFHSHASELRTLVNDDKFYLSKSKVIEFHNAHTPEFKARQASIGFSSELESWYSEISAIIHGQIPGVWTTRSLSETSFSKALNKAALREFTRSVLLINYLFLLTMDEETWEGFSSPARQLFLKGMSGNKKRALGRAVV
jgi:hypothetical protein